MAVLSDAGTKYDIVLSDLGLMLAGLMTRVEVTNLMPRVSMATDQKQYHDFSELEVFGQQDFHHGRGQLNMEEVDRFYDSWNMDLRFSGKAFPALAPTESGDLAGAINDMVYYEHHPTAASAKTLFALVETSSATVTETITASADDVEEGDDTTYDATSTTAKVGKAPATTSLNIPIEATGEYDCSQNKINTTTTEFVGYQEAYVGIVPASPYDWRYRMYLSFNTGLIPDGATITAATLRLWVRYNESDQDFYLRVRKHPGWSPTLESADWRTTPGSDHLMNTDYTTVGISENSWVEIPFTATYLSDISSTARTEFYVTSNREEAATDATQNEYLSFATYEFNPTYAPQLEVTYTTVGAGSYDMGLRFQTVALPHAAVATSAKITVNVASVVGTTAVRIYGLKETDTGDASCGAFGSGGTITAPNRPSKKTKTTAYKNWSISATGVQDTPDLTNIVNEISVIDPAAGLGWDSGDNMGFVFLDQGNSDDQYATITTFDGNPDNDAVLTVTYTGTGANKLYYLRVADSVWTEETAGLASSGGGGYDLEVYNRMLVVAQHATATAVRYRPGDTPAWEAFPDSVQAKFFKTHDSCLWRATYNSTYTIGGILQPRWEVHYSANADADAPTWQEITLLRSAVPITGLDSYSNLLTVHYEDGMWQVEKDPQGSYRAFRPINQTPVRDAYNGRAHVVFKERYYYSERHGMVEYDGNGIQAMGPDRTDIDPEVDPNNLSLTASNRGPVISLTQDGEFMWALTYSPYTVTPNQNVMVFNSQGWSHYASGPSGTANTKGAICYQARVIASANVKLNSYDTLWFTAGSKIYYIAFDPYFKDPSAYDAVNGSYFQTSCMLKTSWHGPLPIVQKNWMRLLVDWTRTEGVTSTIAATIIPDGGSGFVLPTISAAGKTETNIPFGDMSLEGVVASRIRTLFTMTTAASTASHPPVLMGYNYRYAYRPAPRLGWTIPIAVYSEQDLLDRTKESVPALTTRRNIQQLAGQSPLKFNDGSPPISAFNELYNPSFEGPYTANIPYQWQVAGTPITPQISYLQAPVASPGGHSWSSLTAGALAWNGLRTTQTFAISPGIGCRASVWAFLPDSSTVAVIRIQNSSGDAVLATGLAYGPGWVRPTISYDPGASYTVYVKVFGVGATGKRVYFDCAELVLNKDYPVTEYLDGEQPRCGWTGVPHGSRSERRGHWLVYITGLTEAFRFGAETAIGTETWGSQVTLALREV